MTSQRAHLQIPPVGEEKLFPLYSKLLAGVPVTKDRETREKKFNLYKLPHVYMGIQGKVSNSEVAENSGGVPSSDKDKENC